jgi:hypothetical protein
MPSFEIYYRTATNYNDIFRKKCEDDPCVLTKFNAGECHIYLIVTEQEIRAGYTGLPHFLDTREDSRTMQVVTDPLNPSAPWKRVYRLPKNITQDIINYLDAEKDQLVL